MHTELETEWQEDRNAHVLFPELEELAMTDPDDAYKEMKKNRKVGNATLAELVDAAWWCVYGLLYSTEDDRTNSLPHDDYFYKDTNFKMDVDMLCKCETMRVETGCHRFPIPKKAKGSAGRKRVKKFADYRNTVMEFTRTLIMSRTTNTDFPLGSEDLCKMTVDVIRSSQEELIGYNPDDVNALRRTQFINIGNFIDDVFIHRGYVRKIQEEGAEILTPEQLEEWETSKARIKQHCDDDNNVIPGFVKAMVNQPGFILEPIS